MHFNDHWRVEGKHAFMGASKCHWVEYDEEKMRRIFANSFASELGTRKHNFAAEAIRLKHRMQRNKQTINAYVNDAIGFRMTPEQVLYYSDNCFGTADAISFEKGILRVHDLKTGVHPGDVRQILIYFALFCLEYKVNPYDIEMIGRIYQSDEVLEFTGEPSKVKEIMEKIQQFDKLVESMKEEML